MDIELTTHDPSPYLLKSTISDAVTHSAVPDQAVEQRADPSVHEVVIEESVAMMDSRSRRPLPVRCQPVLPIKMIFGPDVPLHELPFPLSDPDVVLTYSGTSAVYQAFHALNLDPGSTVLCPSYNCGHEIEPLTRLGLRVECYRVKDDLQLDLEGIGKRINGGIKALMVTHYFGFAQPLTELRQLCDQNGVFLVEDCAHAFLSDNANHNLGRVGDVAIYSMRKTLPIPNGGAVIFNNPAVRVRGILQPPPRMTTWLKSLKLVTKSVLDNFSVGRSPRDLLLLVALLPLLAGSRAVEELHGPTSVNCYDPDDEDYQFSIDIMGWAISKFSSRLLARLDWNDAMKRRRSNYRFLAGALADVASCRVMLPSLPDATCPLYFPIWVEHPIDVYYRLARQRIYADVFWQEEHPAIDWERFPEARELKQHVLVLPVHQDVDMQQLEHLVAVIGKE